MTKVRMYLLKIRFRDKGILLGYLHMNKRSLYLMGLVLLLLISIFIVKNVYKNYTPQINLSGLAIKDLNGSIVDLAGFTGKPLVINFWGTWCGPCRQELPGFEKAKKKYGSQVNFLMVSDEPVKKIMKFKAENNYTFFYAQSQKTFHDVGITSVPVTYFYDAKGNLIFKKKDPMNDEVLNEIVEKMIR